MAKARVFMAQCDNASPDTIRELFRTGAELLAQGDLHDGPGFDRVAHAVSSPAPARACESFGDLDAPGLIGRSIDVNG